MNSRERILGIAVGAILVAIVGYLAVAYVSGQFDLKNKEVTKLEGEIAKAKKSELAGKLAAKKLTEYEARSLPANPDIASGHYHNWLLSEVQKAGLSEPSVIKNSSTPEKGFGDKTKDAALFTRHTYTIAAKGTLPQLVQWLHTFYGVDWLHKITQLRLKPNKDKKELEISIKVEALSLTKAKDTESLVMKPSKRLALPDEQAYYNTIVGRNLFGPANNPPKLTISGSKDVYLGRQAELTLKGSDPDPLDKVTKFKLVKSPDDNVKFDEDKGRLTWTPKQPGKYEFTFQGYDDGFPSLPSKEEKFVINVSTQPVVIGKPPRDFDHAKFTILTAVLDLDGQGEIWLHIRPLGEIAKLHKGDHFEIGSIEGTVAEIGQYEFSFTCNGKLHKLAKGEILDKAQVVGDAPVAAAGKPSSEPTAGANDADKSAPASVPAGTSTPVKKDDRAS